MPALDAWAAQKIEELCAQSRLRAVSSNEDNSQRTINFSSNDYLALSKHPEVIAAGVAAAERYGAGAGASRLVTGNYPLYAKLEQALAAYKYTDAALVYGSGYLANIGVVTALVGEGGLILADKLVHASLIDAMKLSGATFRRFRHNDTEHCGQLLSELRGNYKNCLILTDGVFSMDGDVAPVDDLLAFAEIHDAWLLVDDAHAMGVLPARKRSQERLIQVGTLSKAAGCYGGYVAGAQSLIDYLISTSRSFIYTTGLPPFVVGSAIKAVKLIHDQTLSHGERVRAPRAGEGNMKCENPHPSPLPQGEGTPLANARYFTSLLGLSEAQSAIVPVIIGSAEDALNASKMLEAEGFLVKAIRPPTVAEGTSRLRFAFSSLHTRAEIERVAESVRKYIVLPPACGGS